MHSVPTQHSRAQRMKRAEPKSFHWPAKNRANALAHLLGGLVGESYGEHLARVRTAGKQNMGETRGEYACLSCARASQNKKRPLHRFDCFALLGV